MGLPPNQWSVADLLDRCSRRPADELAWEEFVHRFQPTIKTNVNKVFNRKTRENTERRSQFSDDTVDDLVQMVYCRLVEDRSDALKRFVGAYDNSIYKYLKLISINVVKDYFRELSAQKRPKISYSLDELIGSDGTNSLLGEAASGLDGTPLVGTDLPFSLDEIETALQKSTGWRHRDRDILIFKLHYLEGMTLDEITRTEGINLSAVGVNSIITRITRNLRKELTKQSRRSNIARR